MSSEPPPGSLNDSPPPQKSDLPPGLRPHTHSQREAVTSSLLAQFQEKFGENLLAVAASASFGRGQDLPFSDLELDVFLEQLSIEGEDPYLQRIVDGMLVEVVYHTRAKYLAQFQVLSADWVLAASDHLVPLLNPEFIEHLNQERMAIRHPRAAFLHQAARAWLGVQEAAGKVLNAVFVENREGIGLLLGSLVNEMLVVAALLNERPFTTFSSYIREARRFPLKPARFDELLDLMVQGSYQDLAQVEETLLSVFAGFEDLFAAEGVSLYDDSLDPRLPNRFREAK